MSVPEASNKLIEAVVPYSRMSMIQLLGKDPTQFTGRQTAEELALLAYNRAVKLSKPGFTCPHERLTDFGYLLLHYRSICGDGYPCFEIIPVNADKPPLTVSQIKDRVEQFKKIGKAMIISNRPYFYEKAVLFPGSAFVIGADTAARLVNVLEDFYIPEELRDMFTSIPAEKFRKDISSTEIRKN